MSTPDPPAATDRLARHRVQAHGGDLHVIEQPGTEPPFVLMHGFPDDSRIYQKLIPHLAPRRAVAFDFLGYGHSGRPAGPDSGQHDTELPGVLDALAIDRAVLVGHDASGPVAVDFALAHPDRVSRLVLMNTYYGNSPYQRLPELIRLLADHNLTPLADAMMADQSQRLWLLNHTAAQFGLEPLNPEGVGVLSVLPQFFGEGENPDALAAIRAWTGALFPAMARQDARIARGDLAAVDVPVSLIWGADDQYLTPDVARHLARLFQHADLHVVGNASHWLQADQPESVARLLKEAN